MLRPSRTRSARLVGAAETVAAFWRESATVAHYSVLTFLRYRIWFLNLSIGPFLFIAPLVFLGDTLVGRGAPLEGRYFEGVSYRSYVGFVVVPLIAVGVTNTIFSWIGGLIRTERTVGTLERLLVSLRFPASLLVGRALGHALFVTLFTVSTLALAFIWLRPDFHVDPLAGFVIVTLHVLATYGMAFAFSSLLLRMEDSFFFQSFVSKALLLILAGASFPITIFPHWLQIVARLFPFTWAFELERSALLRAEPLGELVPGVALLAGMTLAMWVFGFVMLGRELNKARQTGVLGGY